MGSAGLIFRLGLVALVAVAGRVEASRSPGSYRAPLRNPALLNIGFVCRWQSHCIRTQQIAMGRSLKHMRSYPPASWKVQLCNRNASRDGTRKDWVGFENCLRNTGLRQAAAQKKRRR